MAEFIGSSGSFTDQQIRDVVNTFASDPYNNPDIRFLLSQGLISDKDFRTGDQLSPEDLAKRATVYALQQALGMPQGEAEAAMATAFIDPVEDQAALQDLAAAYEQSMLGGISNEDYLAAAGRAGLTSVDQYDVMRLLEAGDMLSEPGSGGLEAGYPSAPAIVEAGQRIADSGVGNMIFTPEYDAPGSDTNRYQLAQAIVDAQDQLAKDAALRNATQQQAAMNDAASNAAEDKAQTIIEQFAARIPRFQIEPPRGYVGEPEVVGAASQDPIDFGNVDYQSSLIRSLRAANNDPLSRNAGVTLLPNLENSTLTLDFNRPPPSGLSNQPKPPGNNSGGGGGNTNGGGNTGGNTGGGGGGPIVIGPGGGGGGIVVGPGGNGGNGGGVYDDVLDDNGDDQLGGGDLGKTIPRDDDTGDDQVGDGNLGKTTGNGDDDTGDDQLGGGKLGGDVSDAEIPDYTDDLWGPSDPTDSGDAEIPDYTNDLWGPSEPTDSGDAEIPDYTNDLWGSSEPSDSSDAQVPDYTDDLWGDDLADMPDYTNDLWGDIGFDYGQASDLGNMSDSFDLFGDVGSIDFLLGDLLGSGGGGGGGGGNSLQHLFMQE